MMDTRTECQKLAQLHREREIAMRAEMKAQAIKEFPVGSKVRYVYTYGKDNEPVYRTAIVTSHSEWNVSLRGPSGGTFTKHAYLLDPALGLRE
jgi:hypothetical protein